jgi:hypothetical protein
MLVIGGPSPAHWALKDCWWCEKRPSATRSKLGDGGLRLSELFFLYPLLVRLSCVGQPQMRAACAQLVWVDQIPYPMLTCCKHLTAISS